MEIVLEYGVAVPSTLYSVKAEKYWETVSCYGREIDIS